MWFSYDGEYLYFTNTTTRQKFRNVSSDPRVSISVNDPDRPYRYLEVRGEVTRIDPDTTGEFFATLAQRYGMTMDGPPADVKDRVVYVVRPQSVSFQ